MNRRGFFQVLGAALSARQLPRIVPVPRAWTFTRTMSYGVGLPARDRMFEEFGSDDGLHRGSPLRPEDFRLR